MFRVIFISSNKILDEISNYEDPFIVDIRKDASTELKDIYNNDYTHIEELVNRGVTRVFLKKEQTGFMKLRSIMVKCSDFERIMLVIYDENDQAKFICGKINEEFQGRDICQIV